MEKKDMAASNYWVVLDIKFMKNTSEQIREASISSIEKLLLDSINAIRNLGYTIYAPDIMIKKYLSGDTLTYQLSAGSYSPQFLVGTETKKPPCLCKYRCGVCDAIHRLKLMTGPRTYAEYVSYYIDFISTE